jgi:hypothetical protein
MTRTLSVLVSALAMLAAFIPTARARTDNPPPPTTRTITVSIDLKDPSNQPMAGVWLNVRQYLKVKQVKTDTNGRAVAELVVPTNASRVFVDPLIVPHPEVTRAGGAAEIAYMDKILGVFLARQYSLDISGTGPDYHLDITAGPALKVTGKLVDASQQPARGVTIGATERTRPCASKRDGTFVIEGLRRGSGAALVIGSLGTQRVQVVPLIPNGDAAELDLGTITLPDDANEPGARYDSQFVLSHIQETVDEVLFGTTASVTLVSADGEKIYNLWVMHGDRLGTWNGDNVKLTAGEYFFVPGNLALSEIPYRLVKALRAGELAQVRAVGVPSFTVTADGPNEFALDLKQALDAVKKLEQR